MKGKFIVLEGVDGSGKTTQIKKVGDFFRESGYGVVCTNEPGGTPIGRKIRGIFEEYDQMLSINTQLLLMVADRFEHIHQLILPEMEKGNVVISDRYHYSSQVYQSVFCKVDASLMDRLSALVYEMLKPDLTLILDLDPKISLSRKSRRTVDPKTPEFFDTESIEFYRTVVNGYRELAKTDDRCKLVDACGDIETTYGNILPHLRKLP